MSFKYTPVQLFTAETFSPCLVVSMPQGEIVDLVVIENIPYLIIESEIGSEITSAHFHLVPPDVELYSDSREYVGIIKLDNFLGIEKVVFIVIMIPDGDFGIHSKEFLATYGTEKRDEIINEMLNPDSKDVPDKTPNDKELRNLWDFDLNGDK